MPNLNRVLLIGNLTRDPELRSTPRGTAVAEMALAINRTWTDESGEKREETTFIDVILWARLAEIADQYLRKGSPVFIEGRLQLDTWDDKQSGQKRSKLRVVGENMQLLGRREESQAPSIPRPAVTHPRPQTVSRSRKVETSLDEPDDIPY
jgi:single-strand DNA-binding protein